MSIHNWIDNLFEPEVSKRNRIPIYSPALIGNEKKYLNKCIDDSWISPKGPFVSLFEKSFARFCCCRYAIACSSGTSALHLALKVLGVKAGDEVIVPTFTMISSALAIYYTGATPVFVDCEPYTGNIDSEMIEEKISRRTKAILPVHIYGTPCDMDRITELAKKHALFVVEDAAEAIGSSYKGKKIGSISDLTTFSLYVNKIVTTGQGGIITTNSKQYIEELKRLNNYYFSYDKHFWHEKIGFNYKISNLEAAVGLAQVENINSRLLLKRRIYALYLKLLNTCRDFIEPLKIPSFVSANRWHVAYTLKNDKYDIRKLRMFLGKNGIETRTFFIPLHLQPPFYKKEYDGKYPNAEKLLKSGFLLPSSSNLIPEDINRICTLINRFFRKI